MEIDLHKVLRVSSITIVFLFVLVCILPEVFAILTYPAIKEQNEAEIDRFIGGLDQNYSSHEKIEKIMGFVVKDYFQTYNVKPTLRLDPLGRFSIYGKLPSNLSDRPHIRLSSILLNGNPHFVAYYKTGACEELAVLFNKTASEAGFKSRMVRTTAEDHVWNEVYIGDCWVHVDPTLYYHYSTGEYPHYEKIWYNYPSAYTELNWYGGYSKIFADGTKEDVSSRYANVGNVSVSFLEPADRIRVKPIDGNRNSFEDTIEGFQYSFDIGCKEYSITAEKDVIPFFLVMQDTCNFTAVDSATTQVELSPHTVKPTLLLQFIFLLMAVLGSGYSIKILLRNSKKNS
jgi:hypothetical protein